MALRTFTRSLMFLAVAALLAAAPPVTHAKSPGYPEWQPPPTCIFAMPYFGHAVGPAETGFVTEVLKKVFREEKLEIEHKNLPYNRVIDELKAGTVTCTLDIKGDSKIGLRAKSTIATFDLAVGYRVRDGFPGVKSMAGQRVASLHGFDLRSLLPVKVLPQSAFDLTTAIEMLDQGHVRYVLDDESLIREAILEAKLPTSEFATAVLMHLNVRPIFANTEEGRMFRDVYDRRIEEMTKKGQLQELLKKHGLSAKAIAKILEANRATP